MKPRAATPESRGVGSLLRKSRFFNDKAPAGSWWQWRPEWPDQNAENITRYQPGSPARAMRFPNAEARFISIHEFCRWRLP